MRKISEITPPLPEAAQRTLDLGTTLAVDLFKEQSRLDPIILALKGEEGFDVISFDQPFTLETKRKASAMLQQLRGRCQCVGFVSEAWSERLTLEQARQRPAERGNVAKQEVIMILLMCAERTLQVCAPILRPDGAPPRLEDWDVRLDTAAGEVVLGKMAGNSTLN